MAKMILQLFVVTVGNKMYASKMSGSHALSSQLSFMSFINNCVDPSNGWRCAFASFAIASIYVFLSSFLLFFFLFVCAFFKGNCKSKQFSFLVQHRRARIVSDSLWRCWLGAVSNRSDRSHSISWLRYGLELNFHRFSRRDWSFWKCAHTTKGAAGKRRSNWRRWNHPLFVFFSVCVSRDPWHSRFVSSLSHRWQRMCRRTKRKRVNNRAIEAERNVRIETIKTRAHKISNKQNSQMNWRKKPTLKRIAKMR